MGSSIRQFCYISSYQVSYLSPGHVRALLRDLTPDPVLCGFAAELQCWMAPLHASGEYSAVAKTSSLSPIRSEREEDRLPLFKYYLHKGELYPSCPSELLPHTALVFVPHPLRIKEIFGFDSRVGGPLCSFGHVHVQIVFQRRTLYVLTTTTLNCTVCWTIISLVTALPARRSDAVSYGPPLLQSRAC